MMNNLFSIFDPSASFSFPLNWISLYMILILLIPSFWILNNPTIWGYKKILQNMNFEFSALLKNKKNNIIMFIAIFTLVLTNNTMGLLSFTFTATSHLAITLSLALPVWLALICYSLINNLTEFFAHLVPSGTPPALMPFMVVIELVSSLIRPITLSVRLAANMVAGHLLLTLLGNQIMNNPWMVSGLIIPTQYLLLTLESAVACIQAYVFSVLTTLYASEA